MKVPWLVVLLRYLALWSFSVSHPLYDTFGRSPEFFVAHRADRSSLALAMVMLSFVPPVLLWLTEAIGRRISPLLERAACWTFTTVLAAPAAIQFLRLFGIPGTGEVALALVVGVLIAAALVRTDAGRIAAAALASLAIISPAVFLFNFNLSLILDARVGLNEQSWRAANGTPVILLVFDQLPTASLLDDNRNLDAVRWPELARLAGMSTWYRNATSVSTETVYSVPSLLSGAYPSHGLPPTLAAHPQNLFTLLEETYSIHAVESLTALAPRAGEAGRRSIPRTAAGILVDAAVVYGHIALPPDLRGRLPRIDGRVAFFTRPEFQTHVLQVEEFAAALKPGTRRLSYLHHMSPHRPWMLRPNGEVYTYADVIPGVSQFDEAWPTSPAIALGALQRHLIQAREVDWAIGRITDRLRELGEFDRSLIIVTSDHGITFTPGSHPRQPMEKTLLDILYVPLFIKYPGQTEGRVSDANVELIDVLPTIAEVLGVQGTPRMVGYPLGDPDTDRGQRKTALWGLESSYERQQWTVTGGGEFGSIQPQTSSMFVEPDGSWIRPFTPCDDLLGAPWESVAAGFLPRDRFHVHVNREEAVEGTGPSEYASGWIVGRIRHDPSFDPEPLVAVSVNGRIEEISRTYSTRKLANGFSVLLRKPLTGDAAIDIFDPAHPRCGAAGPALDAAVRRLTFSSRDPGDVYGSGWSGIEAYKIHTLRWAIGPKAQLHLRLPSSAVHLRIRAATHSGNPSQVLTVKVNGQTAGQIVIPVVDLANWLPPILIPADEGRPRTSLVELEFAQFNKPAGSDPRALAVSFHEFVIDATP